MLALVVLVLPVPWRHVSDSAVGIAWGLDDRLIVDDVRLDPAGRWSWLTVGRPALVGELAWQRARAAFDADAPPVARDIRVGSVTSRPEHVERVAVAVGLQRAGIEVDLGVAVHVSDPLAYDERLPDRARLTHLNGVALRDRASVHEALATDRLGGRLTFSTADGTYHVSRDGQLPYRRVEVVDVAPDDIDAAVGGKGAPYSWVRSMAMGSSHGLMMGLVTYASASGDDLAAGRHVAGTGQLLGDGTVGTIGGLRAKAGAARRQGADVLLVPASQLYLLQGFDAGDMEVVPVRTIDDAIDRLRETATD